MLPQTQHPTTLSLVHSENHTVLNVLVDLVICRPFTLLCDLSWFLPTICDKLHTYRAVQRDKFLLEIMMREKQLRLTKGSQM